MFACLVAYSSAISGAETLTCRLTRYKPLMLLGKYSYGVYVLHLFVTYYVLRIREVVLVRMRNTWELPLALISVVLTLLASVGAALISWTVLESPCLEQKRHFPYFERSDAAVTTNLSRDSRASAAG